MSKNRTVILLIIGILLIALSQIVKRYSELPDFVYGLGIGVGIGLMISSFVKKNSKNAN